MNVLHRVFDGEQIPANTGGAKACRAEELETLRMRLEMALAHKERNENGVDYGGKMEGR